MGWFVAGYLVVLAVIDARTGRIRNVLSVPLLGASVLLILAEPSAGAAAVAAAVPYLIGFFGRGCGGGDVKMAVGCGALLGNPLTALLAVAGAGALTAAACLATGRSAVPHGPALVLATVMLWLVPVGNY
ncbi:prepilin peptidase [Gordonia alkaliphila]|uniref:Prepilin type IV endopeptidase peptidase domain-containing protein n=1 Tax=Gordonia alkaliphila TaxID=1053547 RepID=A0ABP8YWD9_9ACTN